MLLLAARYYPKQASTIHHHSKELMARRVLCQRREDMLPSQEPVKEFRRVYFNRDFASLEGSPELRVVRNRP